MSKNNWTWGYLFIKKNFIKHINNMFFDRSYDICTPRKSQENILIQKSTFPDFWLGSSEFEKMKILGKMFEENKLISK